MGHLVQGIEIVKQTCFVGRFELRYFFEMFDFFIFHLLL